MNRNLRPHVGDALARVLARLREAAQQLNDQCIHHGALGTCEDSGAPEEKWCPACRLRTAIADAERIVREGWPAQESAPAPVNDEREREIREYPGHFRALADSGLLSVGVSQALFRAADAVEEVLADLGAARAERDAYKRAKAENDERYMGERDEARAEAQKWRRIRTPTHGSCCTCQACGLNYDDCRCDLDEIADELAAARAELVRLRAEQWRLLEALRATRGAVCRCGRCDTCKATDAAIAAAAPQEPT